MFRSLCLAALVTVVASAESPNAPRDLLADHTLAAWELITLPAAPGSVATICTFQADGSLAVAGKPVSYLATKAAFTDYRLHLEWRWPANAAKNSNSGILLHISGGPTGGTAWPVCFQTQLKLAHAGDLLPMNGATFAEKLSTAPDAKTPQLDRTTPADPEKALGEWNSCDVVARDGWLEIRVNGVPANRVTRCTPASGRIGIQLEGTPFELRNLRLEPRP